MPVPNAISHSELNRLIGTPAAPVLLDVCIDEDFAVDPFLIPGSFRYPFRDVAALGPRLSGHNVVVICQKGLKLSQGAAALLRSHGVAARYLEGGILAWRDRALPRLPAAALPDRTGDGSRWVGGQGATLDCLACAWLVRRFVDPKARFLFVEQSEVLSVADRFGATPLDFRLGDLAEQADRCAFDEMLDAFDLRTPALDLMSRLVRGVAADRPALGAQVAGLSAIGIGLTRLFEDDLDRLDAAMTALDAFYLWARDGTDKAQGMRGQEE